MKKGQLISGSICLGIAVLLVILNFNLPPEKMMFTVGDQNMPFLPPIILGIVGGVLLYSAFTSRKEPEEDSTEIT
jgi:hypothetical protein